MEPKILIATPCMGTLDVRYVQSLEALDRTCGRVITAFTENSLVYSARDHIVGVAKDEGADYVLWIDSDMVFPSDALKMLLEDDVNIVSGLCFRRRPPFTPCIWKTIKVGLDANEVTEYPDYPRESLFPVEGCGMAFCLMRTEVLLTVAEAEGSCFQPLRGFGEDVSFCLRARRQGFDIWCDSRVRIGHVGTTVVGEGTFFSWRDTR